MSVFALHTKCCRVLYNYSIFFLKTPIHCKIFSPGNRKREDILYNIFMIETRDSAASDWAGLKRSGEPHYGRLASLDVTVLDSGNNENNYF